MCVSKCTGIFKLYCRKIKIPKIINLSLCFNKIWAFSLGKNSIWTENEESDPFSMPITNKKITETEGFSILKLKTDTQDNWKTYRLEYFTSRPEIYKALV